MDSYKTVLLVSGLSLLEGKDDLLEDWRNKFVNTYTVSQLIAWFCMIRVHDLNTEYWHFEFHNV